MTSNYTDMVQAWALRRVREDSVPVQRISLSLSARHRVPVCNEDGHVPGCSRAGTEGQTKS